MGPDWDPQGDRASGIRFGRDDTDFAIVSFDAPGLVFPDVLGEAERDVCRRLVEGESNAAIARARGTSVRTVANQVARIFRKLGLSGRSALVLYLLSSDACAGRRR